MECHLIHSSKRSTISDVLKTWGNSCYHI